MNWIKSKIAIKKIVSGICVILILLSGLVYCDRVLVKKDSYKKYEPFFDSKQDFDVLFLGSSHVVNGVSPLYLYNNYGITSFNVSMHGNYIPSNYYRLQEILRFLENQKRTLPRTVVVDVYADKDSTHWLHLGWDDFPLSVNKMKMASALVTEEDRAEMLIPFLLYHSRWNEVTKDDFKPDLNKYYGVSTGNYGLSYPDKEIITNPLDKTEIAEETADYLERIKAVCEEAGIQLVLIQIPYSYRPDLQRAANGICQYEEEQGILCVNYMNKVTEIDYDIDFFDAGHLNPTGMRIMTEELGELLSDLGMEDHRGEAQSEQWEQAYEEYIQFRITRIKETKDAKTCLMAINDPDLISTVQIYEGMLGDIQVSKLIERLKEEGNRIIVTEERPEIVSGEGQVKCYDVYCEVYRRSYPETIVHTRGFTI